jgi:hypothetical protein
MKQFIIALALLFASVSTFADQRDRGAEYASKFMVFYLYENVRVVLATDIQCDNGMTGKKASAQRMDGMYIPGCWYLEPTNKLMVRINWIKGDFSIIPLKEFEPSDTADVPVPRS